MLVGKFDKDQPVGRFVYWHANGQRSLSGNYVAGRRQGKWTWWHSNGMKLAQGAFRNGDAIGKWAWWTPQGALQQRVSEMGVESPALEMLVDQSEGRETQPESPSGDGALPVSTDFPELPTQP